MEEHWPRIWQALLDAGLADRASVIAAIATIGTESEAFLPVDEVPGPDHFQRYEDSRILGNTQRGDGARYHGRGFIQLTGRWNYGHFGRLVGQPLESQPELASRPDVAARVFVAFFRERWVHEAARRGDRPEARRRVNGGAIGLARFTSLVEALRRLAGPP